MLTKTDFDEIDKRSQKTIGKIIKKAISDNNKIIETNTKQAIYDNNSELFKIFLTKQDAKEMFVSKDEFHEAMDKNFELLDKIYGHVKKMDQEQTVMNHRITRLENPAFSN